MQKKTQQILVQNLEVTLCFTWQLIANILVTTNSSENEKHFLSNHKTPSSCGTVCSAFTVKLLHVPSERQRTPDL